MSSIGSEAADYVSNELTTSPQTFGSKTKSRKSHLEPIKEHEDINPSNLNMKRKFSVLVPNDMKNKLIRRNSEAPETDNKHNDPDEKSSESSYPIPSLA